MVKGGNPSSRSVQSGLNLFHANNLRGTKVEDKRLLSEAVVNNGITTFPVDSKPGLPSFLFVTESRANCRNMQVFSMYHVMW